MSIYARLSESLSDEARLDLDFAMAYSDIVKILRGEEG
jgi:hypothetical protein